MEISPGVEFVREWGKKSSLTVKQISAKICRLLSVTVFLHASNIHRIEEKRKQIEKDVLNLVIVTTKEKLGSHRIDKPLQIKPHADLILYTVMRTLSTRKRCIKSLSNYPN
ncbi:hypothetical protein AYI70_g8434 [Smittium culicis]|uniref:Uncharacterized protein n=1 Tax=Smittium culicis TaxID=133412 RepID=A0A1R1XFY8_9FUNG|nr:hypothetical protein AYI70_g9425 [Smittium culicis]OMJ13541.1 hypothetical protein AYI70_g8434 [Smittium culicis]